MADWPSGCPQYFDSGSYSFAPMENRVISEMDAGPGKQRQRFTAVPFIHSGSMVMTLTEFSTFQTFVSSTVGYADSFTFPNPLTSGADDITVRFDPRRSPPYSVTDDRSPDHVRVSFSLMEAAV